LDCLPEYSKEAEGLLSKALKQDPTLVDGWLALGHCMWKRENLTEALSSFLTAETLAPTHKVALREVARVLRLTGDPAARRANLSQAAEKARRAVASDVTDGVSWYVLGNCLLSRFMQVGGDPADLAKALKAYTQAEAKGERDNPDLHFNKAVVLKYQADFPEAYGELLKAMELDPSLKEAGHEMVGVRHALDLLSDWLTGRKGPPPRALDRRLADFPRTGATVPLDPPRVSVPIQAYLTNPRLSDGCMVLLVLNLVSRSTDSPLLFAACDVDRTSVAVTIYNVTPSAVREGDELLIPNPTLRQCAFTLPAAPPPAAVSGTAPLPPDAPAAASELLARAATYDFWNVVVEDPTKVLVGRKPIPLDRLHAPELVVTTFT